MFIESLSSNATATSPVETSSIPLTGVKYNITQKLEKLNIKPDSSISNFQIEQIVPDDSDVYQSCSLRKPDPLGSG